MNLTDNRLKELDNPSLTRNERLLLRCRLASEFIHIGQVRDGARGFRRTLARCREAA
jgi:hypothetical protein